MDIRRLAERAPVARARRDLWERDEETLRSMIAITEIPAPTFEEDRRGDFLADSFRQLGLPVDRDAAGNVLARLEGGSQSAAPVLVSAHLDTIFPAGTDVRVRRNGERLEAPGIADNGRGLAALLAMARALVRGGVEPERPIVFAATVGEEGVGDLRGVKHLFGDGSEWRDAAAFVSLDGSGRRRIVNRAVGSKRLKVTIRGPGGHSWADWGVPNPIHALGAAVAEIARLPGRGQPRSVASVGRLHGGTSVNAIPQSAWAELDLRSESADAIVELERRVRDALAAACAGSNDGRRRGAGTLELDIQTIGDRPTGETPPSSPLVRAARAATRWIGESPELVASSTDANVPMALGIPAVALGAGGESGGTHTLGEWYRNRSGPAGIERALLVTLWTSQEM